MSAVIVFLIAMKSRCGAKFVKREIAHLQRAKSPNCSCLKKEVANVFMTLARFCPGPSLGFLVDALYVAFRHGVCSRLNRSGPACR